MLKEHHLISHALVYGEGKSYLVALITLNQAEADEYARAHGIAGDRNKLTDFESIHILVQKIIDKVNARVSSTESIKRFAILDRDFEVEKDEVTPTGKVKREVVTEQYRDEIESLYA